MYEDIIAMSFIRIKIIKGRPYYYRQTNVRMGNGRVRSKMEYLGPVNPSSPGSIPLGPHDDPVGPFRFLANHLKKRFGERIDGQAISEEEMIWKGWMKQPEKTEITAQPVEERQTPPIEITGKSAHLTNIGSTPDLVPTVADTPATDSNTTEKDTNNDK
jgi:hypothetical protein